MTKRAARNYSPECLNDCYGVEASFIRGDTWERYRRFMRARWGLGEAESRVAIECVRGLRNTRSAVRLGVSAETVNKHLDQVYRKAGVRGRAELAAILLQMEANPERG